MTEETEATTDVATRPETESAVALRLHRMTPEQVDLIKTTIAVGTTDAELALFIEVCNATGLNPFKRQIHAVKRWDTRAGREVMAIQTGIDGYRLLAERTGKYLPGLIEFCGSDEVWSETWLRDTPPLAARATVYRRDFTGPDGAPVPIRAVAHWRSYAQTNKDGVPTAMWKRMGELMLGKCAEALAIRRAFPDNVSGIYTDEEMQQAEKPPAVAAPKPMPAAAEWSGAHEQPKPMPEQQRAAYEETAQADASKPQSGAIEQFIVEQISLAGREATEQSRQTFYNEWLPAHGFTGKTVSERWSKFLASGNEYAGEVAAYLVANRAGAATAAVSE